MIDRNHYEIIDTNGVLVMRGAIWNVVAYFDQQRGDPEVSRATENGVTTIIVCAE